MNVIRVFNRLEEDVIVLLLVTLTLLVFVETVMRFGFGTTYGWAEEGSLTLAGWLVLFGASHGIKHGTHIGVDLVTRALPSRIKRVVGIIAALACLVYAGLFLYGSWVYLSKMWMLSLPMEDLPVPTWAAHSIMFIGFAMIALRLLVLLWQIARGGADGFAFADEAREHTQQAESQKAESGQVRSGEASP